MSPLIVNVVLTPAIIQSFGLARYGLFLLSSTIVTFLGSFDAGVSTSVVRWSAIYAARGDRAATTRLITSLFGVLTLLGAALSTLLFFCAPGLMTLFNVPPHLRDEGVVLLRTMGVIVGVSQVRGLFAGQLSANQRYAWQSLVTIGSYAVYAAGLIVTVNIDAGLRGVAITFLLQAAVATVLIFAGSLRFLDLRAVGLMKFTEFKEFMLYAARVQALGLTGIITNQADTFIVGRALGVSGVAMYGTGLNFATQLRNLPINVLGPIATSLSQAYGRGGDGEALAVFERLQSRWVAGCTAWCSVALGAAYFGITSWLGPQFALAGVVACVLTAANAVNLWTGALTTFLAAVGRPGIELRYAVVSLGVNLALTVPGVILFGLLGTVTATCAGTVVGSLYLIRIVHTHYDVAVRSFLRDVPIPAALVTILCVVALEAAARPLVPSGAIGLLSSGLVAAPGLLVFACTLYGPTRTIQEVAARLRRSR